MRRVAGGPRFSQSARDPSAAFCSRPGTRPPLFAVGPGPVRRFLQSARDPSAAFRSQPGTCPPLFAVGLGREWQAIPEKCVAWVRANRFEVQFWCRADCEKCQVALLGRRVRDVGAAATLCLKASRVLVLVCKSEKVC